jgi:hypothetical protein
MIRPQFYFGPTFAICHSLRTCSRLYCYLSLLFPDVAYSYCCFVYALWPFGFAKWGHNKLSTVAAFLGITKNSRLLPRNILEVEIALPYHTKPCHTTSLNIAQHSSVLHTSKIPTHQRSSEIQRHKLSRNTMQYPIRPLNITPHHTTPTAPYISTPCHVIPHTTYHNS